MDNKTSNHHNVSWQAINHFYFDKKKQSTKDLQELIKLNKNKNILISSENFENLKFTKDFNNFVIKVKKTHNLKIIWTIREQSSYLLSLLSMLINKGAFVNDFDLLVKKIKANGKLKFKPYIFWFDYFTQYKNIINCFKIKKKDIYLNIYLKNGNIFENFCDCLSIKIKVKKGLFMKNTSNSLFQNSKNFKNRIKNITKYKNTYFNKNLEHDNKNFFSINKTKNIILKKNYIFNKKNEIQNYYRSSNLKLFKLFKIKKSEIRKFYE